MQKVNNSKISKEEKKANKIAHRKELKELVKNENLQQKKRKELRKQINQQIKADKPVQKEYIKEYKDFITNDKPNIPNRIKEVEKWWETVDKTNKLNIEKYKHKLAKAKKPDFKFEEDIFVENVGYTYGVKTPFEFRALNGASAKIQKNKITAVIGVTGSGKSTLIQLLNGLIISETGRVKVGNYQILSGTKKLKEVKELRREIGLVFQFPEYQLFQDTIEKDISFGPINLGGIKQEALEAVPKLLDIVKLPPEYLRRSPFDLSGGQKRRVAIAGIIAMGGQTLVLDEPTGGLDPEGEEDFIALFDKLNKEQGKRIVIVTHNMDHVLQIADEVIVMHEGKVLAIDTPFNVFTNEELLSKTEIELPKLYKLAYELKKQNLDITQKHFRNVKELAEAIKSVKK